MEQSKNLYDNLGRFGMVLEKHIRFEEREGFKKIQETFSIEQLNKIEDKLTGA